MNCRNLWRFAAICAVSGNCAPSPSLPRLELAVLVGEADTAFGLLNRMDVRGCTIGIYDHSNHLFHLWNNGPSWRAFGSFGEGPGEVKHPMAIAVSPMDGLLVLDWGRRRIIRFDSSGRPLQDLAIGSMLGRQGFVGGLLALENGRWVETPLGGQVVGRISKAHPDSLVLTTLYGPDGSPEHSWGELLPVPVEVGDVPGALELWQAGETLLWGDSLVVWFNRAGIVHIYDFETPSPQPVRWFSVGAPREVHVMKDARSAVDSHGFLKASAPPFEPIGGPAAIDPEGRLYLVLFEPVTGDGNPWPRERLAVFELDGSLIAQYRLPTRNTRTIKVAQDGSILLLSHPSADPRDSWSLLLAKSLFPSHVTPCSWPQRAGEH